MKDCERYLELISRQVDNDLNKEEQDELFSHLAVCEHCSARYEVYKAMTQALSGLGSEPPETMAQGVIYKIETDKRKGFFGKRSIAFTCIAAVAAAVILAVSGAFGNLGLLGNRFGAASGMSMSADETAALNGASESGVAEARAFSAQDEKDAAQKALIAPETTEGQDNGSAAISGEQAPGVPFSRIFYAIVVFSGADYTQLSQYEQVKIDGQVYIFVPRDELEAFIAGQDEGLTVYREGVNIDQAVDTGLVIIMG